MNPETPHDLEYGLLPDLKFICEFDDRDTVLQGWGRYDSRYSVFRFEPFVLSSPHFVD